MHSKLFLCLQNQYYTNVSLGKNIPSPSPRPLLPHTPPKSLFLCTPEVPPWPSLLPPLSALSPRFLSHPHSLFSFTLTYTHSLPFCIISAHSLSHLTLTVLPFSLSLSHPILYSLSLTYAVCTLPYPHSLPCHTISAHSLFHLTLTALSLIPLSLLSLPPHTPTLTCDIFKVA
ncbi:unnamed protein product [Acanthosepion pharaonis]|uniref:Uncharacterized protein n=1 Tax=Acanthosepion pharaonis TaxID=158019 RepID=A0A812APC0_ACAPH|nr:unnamed protein product [Sepia pharaonis]